MPETARTPDPDVTLVRELLEANRRSKTMFAAVSLGIFDALSDQPKTLATLATELNCNDDALERLLDANVGIALLEKSSAGYKNLPAANKYLTTNSPQRLTGYIKYSNDVLWKLWGHLEDAVREGKHRWTQVYGWDGPIFTNFFRDEAAKRDFLFGMHGYGLISSPEVVAAFDLSRFKTICDLGGATGHLTIAACEHYSSMHGIVFDLAAAAPLAREIVGESKVADRIQIVEGDFFADELPPADLYAVGRILHDWSEDKIKLLLKRVYDRLPAGGGLLIAEKLLNLDKTGPGWAQMQSLNMLVCTEGKERTLAEYEALLKSAGFKTVDGRTTNSPLDATLAVK
jgi:acetylserotonin N-methyltransferase